jgi:hypothetical protein
MSESRDTLNPKSANRFLIASTSVALFTPPVPTLPVKVIVIAAAGGGVILVLVISISFLAKLAVMLVEFSPAIFWNFWIAASVSVDSTPRATPLHCR